MCCTKWPSRTRETKRRKQEFIINNQNGPERLYNSRIREDPHSRTRTACTKHHLISHNQHKFVQNIDFHYITWGNVHTRLWPLISPDLFTGNFPGLLARTIRSVTYWYVFWRALIEIGVLQPEIIENNHHVAHKFSAPWFGPVCRWHHKIILLLE